MKQKILQHIASNALKKLFTLILIYTLTINQAFSTSTSTATSSAEKEANTNNVQDSKVTTNTAKDSNSSFKIQNPKSSSGLSISAQMLSALTLILAIPYSAKLMTVCNTQPSAWIFSGTTAIYFALEVSNWGKYKKASKLELEIVNSNNIKTRNEQIEAFWSAYRHTKNSANAVENKSKNAKIAAIGFTVATIAAIVEHLSKLYGSYDDICIGFNNKLHMDWFYASTVFKKAFAGTEDVATALGITGGALAALYVVNNQKIFGLSNIALDGLYRSIVFGVLSGVAAIVAAQADSTAKTLHQRANQYKMLAEKLEAITEGKQPIKPGTGISNSSKKNIPTISNLTSTTSKSTTSDYCFTGNNAQLNLDASCGCQATNSCKSTELNKANLSKLNLPSYLTDSLGILGKAANDTFNGKSTFAGTVAANGLAKNAANIERFKNDLLKKIQSKNKKPLNIEQETKKIKDKLQKEALANFSKLSPSDQTKLLDFINPTETNDSADTKVNDASKNNTYNNSKDKNSPSSGTNPLTNKNSTKEDENLFSEIENKNGNAENNDGENKNDLKDNEKYLIEGNDISSNRNDDIFKQISVRYLKSAYPILLEAEPRR